MPQMPQMPQIPTPPASRPGSEAPETEKASSELRQSLDTLLEQYLYLLDRQQELQLGLAKQLSSGFLSLAHANYTCPPGRRYGADYYDDRMKATRTISIWTEPKVAEAKHTELEDQATCSQSNGNEYRLAIDYTPRHKAEQPCEIKSESQLPRESRIDEDFQPESGSSTAESDTPVQDANIAKTPTKEPKNPPTKFQSDNPIYWYGILVPLSLRNAQNAFTEGILSHVPELAAVTVQMRALEQQVIQLRNRLEG